MKKIKKYDINDLYSGNPKKDFSSYEIWWQRECEPVNKMLEEAILVYGQNSKDGNTWCSDYTKAPYRALLINIEPIKKDTAEGS